MEIRVLKQLFLCLLTVSSLGACLEDEPVGGGGNHGGEEVDVPASDVTSYKLGTPIGFDTGIDGLSAICLNESGNGLLVAEDNGHILEFDFEGNHKASHSVPGDWEGITKAADGSIYLSEERTREVYRLSADHKSVTLVSKGPDETSESGYEINQGYEGIAAAPGILYVANQSGPKRVYAYSLANKTWSKSFDATWATSLSDIFYDAEDGTLWITDAKTQKLTQLKTDGTRLQNIDISFINKPEGFCKDSVNKVFWFVCDKKKKLHKVSYQ